MPTTLITGANRGIGLALAKAAAHAGHTVIGTARRPREAHELAQTGARVLPLDVADPVSIGTLITELNNTDDPLPIDYLINNAAIFPNRGGLDNVDLDAFDLAMKTNVRGPLAVTRALLPNLHAGEKKTLATISSTMGSITKTDAAGSYAYRMSKSAINMMTKILANEFEDLTALAIDPGWVKTDMGGTDAQLTPEESASGILDVLTSATRDQSGSYLRYDGSTLPW